MKYTILFLLASIFVIPSHAQDSSESKEPVKQEKADEYAKEIYQKITLKQNLKLYIEIVFIFNINN